MLGIVLGPSQHEHVLAVHWHLVRSLRFGHIEIRHERLVISNGLANSKADCRDRQLSAFWSRSQPKSL